MADETVQGMADAYALIDRIPDAAQREAGRDLADIGKIILQAQQDAVPKDTGALSAGLSVQVQIDQLRVRSGLIGLRSRKGKTNLGDLYYGIIVNYGRRGQVVTVERRRSAAAGRLVRGRKAAEDISTTYALRVKPLEPREFIDVSGTVGPKVDAATADFWTRTFTQLPGGNA